MDKGKMFGTDAGELYDKFYQTMGMNDMGKIWKKPAMPNMNSNKY